MTVETINPATGKVEYRHELMTAAQVDATARTYFSPTARKGWAPICLWSVGRPTRGSGVMQAARNGSSAR